MSHTKEKLFEYSIFCQPNEKESNEGKKTEIVQEIKTVLAVDEKNLMMKIIREIPDKYAENLEQVDIVVRPF